MKVALCFIISYEHVLNKEQLWIDWIKPNKDLINIYFHYKNINYIKSPFIKLHTIPPKVTQKTSYYNVVPAYMSLLTYAYEHDKENQWFCLLTDSCVPIISPEKFRNMFSTYYYKSIIKCKPAYWNITIHRRANLRLLGKEYWLANDPWFTLCRDHVYKCVMFLTMKNDIYNKINMGGLANESIFAIILQTFGEITNNQKLINESATLSDWQRMSSPTSPYLFEEANDENINVIEKLLKENPCAMFLRKVHKRFPDEAIKTIMNRDKDSYTIGEKKNQYFNNTYIQVFLLFLSFSYFVTRLFTEFFMNSSVFRNNM